MCRSVPQTEATFTLTRTSVKPILGMATSRTSAPGFGSGFTTASMVSAIQVLAFRSYAPGDAECSRKPLILTFVWGLVMCSQVTIGLGSPLILLLPGLGHAQRLPARAAHVLRQIGDLTDVIGVVQRSYIERLQHGIRLAADCNGALHVFRPQFLQTAEQNHPTLLPNIHELGAGGAGCVFKLLVAMAVGFFSIASQELREAGAEIAGYMLDEQGATERFGIGLVKKLLIADLCQGAFGELLIGPQSASRFGEISRGYVVHMRYFIGTCPAANAFRNL